MDREVREREGSEWKERKRKRLVKQEREEKGRNWMDRKGREVNGKSAKGKKRKGFLVRQGREGQGMDWMDTGRGDERREVNGKGENGRDWIDREGKGIGLDGQGREGIDGKGR